MVDGLVAWGMKPKSASAARNFGNGKESCHLSTDGPIEELHEFARKVGLTRWFFHNTKVMPHYDLTPAWREKVLAAGAVFVDGRDQARARRALRQATSALTAQCTEPALQLIHDGA
jgi:hypothetical protein